MDTSCGCNCCVSYAGVGRGFVTHLRCVFNMLPCIVNNRPGQDNRKRVNLPFTRMIRARQSTVTIHLKVLEYKCAKHEILLKATPFFWLFIRVAQSLTDLQGHYSEHYSSLSCGNGKCILEEFRLVEVCTYKKPPFYLGGCGNPPFGYVVSK